MANFIKKWMPDKGTYDPRYSQPSVEQQEALATAARKLRNELVTFAQELGSIDIRSMKVNKTGRKINVRARMGGRSVGFSVFPYEEKSVRPRTLGSLAVEVCGALLSKREVTVRGEKVNLRDAFTEEAKQAAERDGDVVYFGHHYVDPEIGNRLALILMWNEVSTDGLDDFLRKIHALVNGGKLDAAFDKHQGGRAIEQFRDMAAQSLLHGVRIQDLHTALDEALVQVTLEC